MNSVRYIAIGSDHAGFKEKEYIRKNLSDMGYKVQDFGTFSEESMDYPDAAHPLAKAIESGEYEFGILICGTGNGMAIVANKYQGIRAALCWNESIAVLARQHNNANVLALPARFIDQDTALRLSVSFITTAFEGGRHERRIEKIAKIL